MKITHFPLQAHCFAFGGFELQMLGAFNAVDRITRTEKEYQGTSVEKIDVWSREGNFDIAQFWGLSYVNSSNIYWAKKAGKKVVVTSLFGSYETFMSRVRHYVSSSMHTAKVNRQLVPYLDALVVVSEEQKEVAVDLFKVPSEKIFIIPNIVHEKFFAGSSFASAAQLPFEKYVLNIGNVCARKNQVNLVKAAIDAKVNLILVGRAIEGEEQYVASLEALIAKHNNIQWYKGLPENSDLLVDLVTNCEAFVLPSYAETQPISLLEAAAARKPLVISNRKFAYQKYYQNAFLIDPGAVSSISSGIKTVLEDPATYTAPLANLKDCSEEAVGRQYLEIYQRLMATR